MKNDWLILPKVNFNDKDTDSCSKLVDIMNQIEDGRGWRFTDEQADALAKLVDGLIEQIKAYNKKRNKDQKRTVCFFK
jgi:hypothetical protein